MKIFPLIVIVLLILGVGGYINTQMQRFPTKPVQASSTPLGRSSPVPELQDEWRSYFNDLYEYQIKLPPGWKQIELSSNLQNMTQYEAPDQSVFEVVVYENQGQSLAQFLEKRDEQNKTGWEGYPATEVKSSNEVKVGDYSGIERIEDLLAAGFTAIVTYLPVGDYIFTFSSLPRSDKDVFQTEAGQNFHLIVSSFVYNRLGRY